MQRKPHFSANEEWSCTEGVQNFQKCQGYQSQGKIEDWRDDSQMSHAALGPIITNAIWGIIGQPQVESEE